VNSVINGVGGVLSQTRGWGLVEVACDMLVGDWCACCVLWVCFVGVVGHFYKHWRGNGEEQNKTSEALDWPGARLPFCRHRKLGEQVEKTDSPPTLAVFWHKSTL
jgi:hypothetical protein